MAKMFFGRSGMHTTNSDAPFSCATSDARRARLTQFRGRRKEPRVLDERITIRHAGNEIGDAAHPQSLVRSAPATLFAPLLRLTFALRAFRLHGCGVRRVAGKEVADHLF